MASFPHPWTRRDASSRLVVVLRGSPAAAARLLPDGARPLLVGGQAVLLVCHTREPRERYRLTSGADHLSYCVAAELPVAADGGAARRSGSWVLERATSSWLEARWSERRGRGSWHRSSFELVQGPFSLELRVEREGLEELYLRAEPAPASTSRLFPGTRDLEAFLERCLDLRTQGFAPEPLALHELRACLLESAPQREFEPDGAFRFVTRPLKPGRASAARRLRAVIDPLPTPLLPST